MKRAFLASLLFALPIPFAACSSSSNGTTPASDAGTGDSGGGDAGSSVSSNIQHIVIVVQENHTFDSHFGKYCTAAAGSNPTCNDGPACCEAIPPTDPSGATPVTIDDAMMGSYDPSHVQACENAEMNGGAMDMYTNAPGCGNPMNVGIADATIIKPYWDLAGQNALADRYFQSLSGQSSSNDMYLARANFVFKDNSANPQGAIGAACQIGGTAAQYPDQTIGDLLTTAGVDWAFFAEGYKAASDASAAGKCAASDPACPTPSPYYPCTYDPGDDPFTFYASSVDNSADMKDFADFTAALTSGSGLPAVSWVKGIGYKTEHPGYGDKLSDGVTFVTGVASAVAASSYASSTLLIVTYDESGGYYDHIAPPATSSVDNQPYGPRIPMMAIGPFAKKNYVSHVQMEHGSLVKFIEWNWLGKQTGQLDTRDKVVNNIGDMLDATATGTQVPAN
ncbi:MAG: phospholipase C [Polyangiaceae bacterium]